MYMSLVSTLHLHHTSATPTVNRNKHLKLLRSIRHGFLNMASQQISSILTIYLLGTVVECGYVSRFLCLFLAFESYQNVHWLIIVLWGPRTGTSVLSRAREGTKDVRSLRTHSIYLYYRSLERNFCSLYCRSLFRSEERSQFIHSTYLSPGCWKDVLQMLPSSSVFASSCQILHHV